MCVRGLGFGLCCLGFGVCCLVVLVVLVFGVCWLRFAGYVGPEVEVCWFAVCSDVGGLNLSCVFGVGFGLGLVLE